MDKISHNRIDDLIESGYDLRISEYVSEAFTLVRENLGVFVGFMLFSGIAVTMSNFTFIGPFLVAAPLTAGYFIAANRARSGFRPEFNDFFQGFHFFGQLVSYSLIWILIILIMAVPAGIIALLMVATDGGGVVGGLLAVSYAIGWMMIIGYLGISFVWAPHLIVFGDMKAWDAMQTSQKLVQRNFVNMLGFVMILGLINFAGALFFGIGVLFTVPATAVAVYLAFEDITGLKEEHDHTDKEFVK